MTSSQSLQKYPDGMSESPLSPAVAGQQQLQSKSMLMAWDGYMGLPQYLWNSFFVFLVVFGMVGQNVTR